MNPWNEQVAIVTGGADGLGLTLSRRLAGRGVRVAIIDRDADKLAGLKEVLPTGTWGIQIDVTQPDLVSKSVDEIAAKWSRIDILVNCAGITGRTNLKSHEVPLEDFDRVQTLNVRACLITFQAVIPHMLKRNYGRILHVASIAGKDGNAGMLAYSVSKAALIGMAKVQGKEYAETGVTVNAIAPAVIETELVKRMPEAQVKYMTDKIPMNRCGTLDEFAAMAEFIISPEASFTTGFTFDLSGGRAVY